MLCYNEEADIHLIVVADVLSIIYLLYPTLIFEHIFNYNKAPIFLFIKIILIYDLREIQSYLNQEKYSVNYN